MRQVFRTLKRASLALVLVALAACSTQYRNHGYVPSEDLLDRVVVGVDTRASVARLAGQPNTTGILQDGGWYYVQSRYRRDGYRAPEEIERQVVAVSFDDGDKVTNIERYSLADGRVVPLSRRVTDSNVKGIGFFRQLFGNIGVLSAEQFFE